MVRLVGGMGGARRLAGWLDGLAGVAWLGTLVGSGGLVLIQSISHLLGMWVGKDFLECGL